MPPSLLRATRLCVLIPCLLSFGAARAQEAKEPTRLDLTFVASAQSNPDDTGRPSPIRVRVYELKDSNNFTEADYFSLSNSDKVLLGADLLAREEFMLRPGETRHLERKSHPQATAIGVLAGYRDLTSVWRHVYTLPEAPAAAWYRALVPSNKTTLTIQLEAQGLVVKSTP